MAYQAIDLGTRGNNLTGDDINEGGVKINANFVELYTTKLESIIEGTNVSINNTDPLNPIISVPSTATNTSDLINDGADGSSTYIENDEIGNLALLDTVDTVQIDDEAITLTKMANANAFSIIGNNTGSAATPLYLTTAQVRTLLNIEDGAAADQTLSIVGNDLTISGGNTITLPTSGGGVTVDATIQNGSSNPVENNAIYDALVDINSFVATGNIAADKLIDGPGSGLDADTLRGYGTSTSATLNTVAIRDANANLLVNNDAYDSSWIGNFEVPNKNTIYNIIEGLSFAEASGNSGSSGLTLTGATSGTYTVGSQSWSWSRAGNIVTFTIILGSISGTTQTGILTLGGLSGAGFPTIASSSIFNVAPVSWSTAYNCLQGLVSGGNITFIYQQVGQTTIATVSDADFSGTAQIYISGSYITS